MLWDVVFARGDAAWDGTVAILQVEAESLTHARRVALPLVGSRSTILRIDRVYPDLPVTDPAKRKVQGT